MKKYALIIGIVCSISSVFAQGVFEFEEKTYNFGEIEEGAPAVHEFVFTNTGDAPIVLNNVRASCGCTTPDWTKDPVNPGEKGIIKASYNTKGRPGNFHKSITINSNAKSATQVLYIKGSVLRTPPKPKYSAEELAQSPIINLSKTNHYFGKAEKGQPITTSMKVTNTGKSDLKLTRVSTSCRCVSIEGNEEAIAPGKTREIKLIYTPNRAGNLVEKVTFVSNDLKNPRVDMTISAQVVESLVGESIIKQDNSVIPFK